MIFKILISVALGLLTMPLLAAEQDNADVSAATTMEQETQMAPATSVANPAVEDQSGFSRGSVVRSAFTTAIENREPVNNLKQVPNDIGRVYYYTELRDMSGQTAIHRWEYNGEVKAEVKFDVRGPRWRVWSSKSFVPGWTGDWKVSVLNGAGEVIAEDMFQYTVADETQSQPPAAPAQAEPTTEPAAPAAQ
jgi:hypothetical protein